jgi:hypothetical protein
VLPADPTSALVQVQAACCASRGRSGQR